MQKFPFLVFGNFVKNAMVAIGIFVFLSFLGFCVIKFVPIKIKTYKAPQNDLLNLSFVKDIYVVGKKLTRDSRKMAIFGTKFSGFFFQNFV